MTMRGLVIRIRRYPAFGSHRELWQVAIRLTPAKVRAGRGHAPEVYEASRIESVLPGGMITRMDVWRHAVRRLIRDNADFLARR